jgi:hypothetical protein
MMSGPARKIAGASAWSASTPSSRPSNAPPGSSPTDRSNPAFASTPARSSAPDLGDLRVRELVGRYLQHTPTPADDRDRTLLSEVIEPTIGDDLAAIVTTAHIENALETTAAAGTPPGDARDTVRLLRRSYQWALHQQWHHDNPAADIDTRWLGR